MLCAHCHRRQGNRGRNLCNICYKDRAIRALYPVRPHPDHEPTQEEVDRIVAEQLAHLPSWWHREPSEGKHAMQLIQADRTPGIRVIKIRLARKMKPTGRRRR